MLKEFLDQLYGIMEPTEFPDIDTVQQVCRQVYIKGRDIFKAGGLGAMNRSIGQLDAELSKVIPNRRRWTEEVRKREEREGSLALPRAADLNAVSLVTMQAIDSAYVKYIQPHKEFLGTDTEEYIVGMEHYRLCVMEILKKQQLDLVNVPLSTATPGERARKMMGARAWVSMTRLPGRPVPLPLLTASVIVDVLSTMDPFESAVKEVSQNLLLCTVC